jgi:tetratricopeptide (TPR) repeat protein
MSIHKRSLVALGSIVIAASVLLGCSTPDDRAVEYLAKGDALLSKGDTARATLEYRNALRHKKDLVPAWRRLAEIEERARNWASLGPILRTIVEYEPTDQDSRLKLARLLMLGGAFEDALSVISEQAEKQDASAAAIAVRAAILLALKDPDGAAKEARRALGIEPSNVDAAVVLASEQLSRNEFRAAMTTLASAKAPLRPTYRLLCSALGSTSSQTTSQRWKKNFGSCDPLPTLPRAPRSFLHQRGSA